MFKTLPLDFFLKYKGKGLYCPPNSIKDKSTIPMQTYDNELIINPDFSVVLSNVSILSYKSIKFISFFLWVTLIGSVVCVDSATTSPLLVLSVTPKRIITVKLLKLTILLKKF